MCCSEFAGNNRIVLLTSKTWSVYMHIATSRDRAHPSHITPSSWFPHFPVIKDHNVNVVWREGMDRWGCECGPEFRIWLEDCGWFLHQWIFLSMTEAAVLSVVITLKVFTTLREYCTSALPRAAMTKVILSFKIYCVSVKDPSCHHDCTETTSG